MSKQEESRTKGCGTAAGAAAAAPHHQHQKDETSSAPIAEDEQDVNSSVVEVVARPPSFIGNQVVSPAFKRESDGSDFPQTFPQKVGLLVVPLFYYCSQPVGRNHMLLFRCMYCKITILSQPNTIVSRAAAE